MAQLTGAPGVDQVAPFGTTLHVVGRDADLLGETIGKLATDGFTVRPGVTSLEDVFIQLMAEPRETAA
jgi:ABC-2 type transport system ATP-binding protein